MLNSRTFMAQFLAFVGLVIAAATPMAQETEVPAQRGLDVAVDAVVTIEVRKDTSPPLADGLGDDVSDATRDRVREVDKALEDADIPRNVTGSGLVVSANGWIATAAHLVEHAERITVQVTGNRKQRARVLGVDDVTDVALIEVNAEELSAIALVSGTCPSLAQQVYAIGAPFGFSGSVTSGIISTVDRRVEGRKGVLLLQSDAAVNPGNSGGALVDEEGRLLGMVSQVYTGSSGYAGISFAVPASALRRAALNILQRAKLKPNWTGINVAGRKGRYPLNVSACEEVAASDELVVSSVRDSRQTMLLDIAKGDVLSAVNGRAITSGDEWDWLTNLVPPGGEVEIQWTRDGNISSGVVVRSEARE